jgi:hypothetical protein
MKRGECTVFFRPTLHQPGVYSGPLARDESRLVRNAQIRGQKKTSVTRDEELVEKKQYLRAVTDLLQTTMSSLFKLEEQMELMPKTMGRENVLSSVMRV